MDQQQYLNNMDAPEQRQAVQEEIKEQAQNRDYNTGGMGAAGAFFRNMLNFQGRSSRREFWWSMLYLTLLTILQAVITALIYRTLIPQEPISIVYPPKRMGLLMLLANSVSFVLFLPLTISQCSLFLRRLRDVGHAKWVFWLYLASILVTQILMNLQAYKLSTVNVLLSQSAMQTLLVHQKLMILLIVSIGITLIIGIVILVIAMFPNKPFAIKDGYYKSNGQRLRIWLK